MAAKDDDIPTDETQMEGIQLPQDHSNEPQSLPVEPDRVRVDSGDDYGDDPEPEEQPSEPAITELTEEERAQFRSLLAIGKRMKTITLFDQEIVISSLMADDEIRIGAKTKEHRDSQAYARAYQCATIAASIQSVNGESWLNTLTENPGPDVLFEQKYNRATKLYGLVIQYIYQEVVELDTEFAQLAAKLGKL